MAAKRKYLAERNKSEGRGQATKRHDNDLAQTSEATKRRHNSASIMVMICCSQTACSRIGASMASRDDRPDKVYLKAAVAAALAIGLLSPAAALEVGETFKINAGMNIRACRSLQDLRSGNTQGCGTIPPLSTYQVAEKSGDAVCVKSPPDVIGSDGTCYWAIIAPDTLVGAAKPAVADPAKPSAARAPRCSGNVSCSWFLDITPAPAEKTDEVACGPSGCQRMQVVLLKITNDTDYTPTEIFWRCDTWTRSGQPRTAMIYTGRVRAHSTEFEKTNIPGDVSEFGECRVISSKP